MTLQELLTRPLPPDSPHLEKISWPLTPTQLKDAGQVLHHQDKMELPWYLRVSMGVGAWLIAVFFGFFSSQFFIAPSMPAAGPVFLGVLLIGAALASRRAGYHPFIEQLALPLSWVGQFLIYFGGEENLRKVFNSYGLPSPTAAAFIAFTLASTLYFSFPLFLSRLATCWIALELILIALLGDNWFSLRTSSPVSIDFIRAKTYVLLLASLAGFLAIFLLPKSSLHWRPLGYALLIFLTGAVLADTLHGIPKELLLTQPFRWACSVALLGAALYSAGGRDAFKKNLLVWFEFIAFVGVLGLLGSSTLYGPLLVMLVGFTTQNLFLTTIGSLLLPLVIGNRFYEMNTDLETKAELLLGTGIILLLLRAEILWLSRDPKISQTPAPPFKQRFLITFVAWRTWLPIWAVAGLIFAILAGMVAHQEELHRDKSGPAGTASLGKGTSY